MDKIKANDIIIILMGITGTLIIAFLIPQEKLINFNLDVNDILWIIALSVIAIAYIIYIKINEINEELKKQDNKQKKLEEKLIIYQNIEK